MVNIPTYFQEDTPVLRRRLPGALTFAALFVSALIPALAQNNDNKELATWIKANYTKYEYLVPMRDGAKLFTSVYVPKDLVPEVQAWIAEHHRLKRLLQEIHQLTLALIRIHVTHRRRRKGRS